MSPLLGMILGAWELVSFEARDIGSGRVRRPLGDRPRGLILYTGDGFMSAQLAPEDSTTELGGYIAYSGPFHVDEQAATVHHDVRMATMADLVTQPQIRGVTLEDGRLILSATMTDAAGTTTHSTLTWQRAGTAQNGES